MLSSTFITFLCSLYPSEDSPSAIKNLINLVLLTLSDTDFPRFRTRYSALNPRVDYQYPAFVNTIQSGFG